MSKNPFWDAVDDALRGTRIRVQTPDGWYEGYVSYFEYDSRSVLLRNATTPAGDHVDTVMVSDATVVESVQTDSQPTITDIAPSDASAQPYSVRQFETPDFQSFVRDIRQEGRLSNLPTVRPIRAETEHHWEVISGHKRMEALRQAGIENHPVEVEQLSDWEATVRFLDAHFPLTDTERDRCARSFSEYYSPTEMHASYQRLLEDWDRERLFDHPAVKANEVLLKADDGADVVHNIVTSDVGTDNTEETESSGEFKDIAAELANNRNINESTVRDDLNTLREHAVPIGAAKGALRDKYQN